MATGQLITNQLKAFKTAQLDVNNASATPTYWGAWGSGSTTPAVTDSALVSENAESRTQVTAGNQSRSTTSSTNDTFTWVYIIVATGTRTVQETGILSASTVGDLYVRIVHGSLALESGDQVTYTVNEQEKDSSE